MSELMNQAETLGPLVGLMDQIMQIPDESLTSNTVIESLEGIINGAITASMRDEAINNLINLFNNQGLSREQVANLVQASNTEINDYINNLQPTIQKRRLLNTIRTFISEIFENAYNQYHSPSLNLLIKLDNGAHIPTYAHSTDAAADIYALEDTVLLAHSLSNIVHTGLRIALPEGWTAYILPRSSMGMKTGLRLSNSIGVIDAGYRGEIGVMYDNHSDSEYVIHKGDRIAQMIIMPTYQFRPQPVDTLDSTDRGTGGFGSTGK